MEITPGSQVALTGRSGSGKTTLLLALAGLLTPTSGQVSWPGLHTDPHRRRAQIGMVFQAPSLMPELTARENVTLPLRLHDMDAAAASSAALAALTTVGIADAADALPAQLSGGQQQRVAIARALAGGHRLVLADEPTRPPHWRLTRRTPRAAGRCRRTHSRLRKELLVPQRAQRPQLVLARAANEMGLETNQMVAPARSQRRIPHDGVAALGVLALCCAVTSVAARPTLARAVRPG